MGGQQDDEQNALRAGVPRHEVGGASGSSSPAASGFSLLAASHAVLSVAARHDDLLRRDAFEELALALARHVPLGRLVITVPVGEEQILYAASIGDSASPLPPFGARFPLPDPTNRRIVMEGAARVCNDTRNGDAVDRLVAQSGYLSYVALPIRERASPAGPGAIIAKMVACFPLLGQASQIPLELLEEVAGLFGARFQRSRLAARERRLAMILETSGDAMLAWNRQGKVADCNLAAALLTGLPRAELLGSAVAELVEELAETAEGELGRAHRTRLRVRRSGQLKWLPVSVSVTAVKDDPVVAMHMLLRDVSHIVAAEQEAAEYLSRVRTLEQEHRTLLDNAPVVIFRIDPATRELRYLNRHAEALLGITPEQARAQPDCLRAAHLDAASAQSFNAAIQQALQGLAPAPYEAQLARPDGTEVTVRAHIYALREAQQVVAIEGILADISAEHTARTQLVQTDRLSTLGRLAAGVAHEINNPAAFLMLGLEHVAQVIGELDGGLPAEERAATLELLGQLTEALQRIADIVRDLRLFAGPLRGRNESAPPLTDVERGVRSALTLTRNQLVERARLVLDLQPVPRACIEQGRLAQVMVNLLVNAAQAIPAERGREHRITVATRSRFDQVEIEVSDTGVGIASADQRRIWAPFFTTKDPGSGTGLGLSISRDLIERAGGTIEVHSPAFEEPGIGPVGSRFVVRLKSERGELSAQSSPPLEARPSLAAQQPPPGVPSGFRSLGRRTILIVEDELPLGKALAQELGQSHDVTLASSGAQALELLDRERFDIILCDVRMPEVSGETVYARACARHPGQRSGFIFMTGLGLSSDLARLHEKYQCPILEKPFSLERVRQAVAEVSAQVRSDASAELS